MFTLAVALLCVSCASRVVDDAFDGKFDYVEETKTIVEYCQSCHIHRKFESGEHVSMVVPKYTREPYLSADRCNTCHTIKRDFWGDITRSTQFPDGTMIDER